MCSRQYGIRKRMTAWLTDAEVVDVTHRRQYRAQGKALERMGVPFKRRPDGSLLVGRAALERALGGVASEEPASNGLTFSKAA